MTIRALNRGEMPRRTKRAAQKKSCAATHNEVPVVVAPPFFPGTLANMTKFSGHECRNRCSLTLCNVSFSRFHYANRRDKNERTISLAVAVAIHVCFTRGFSVRNTRDIAFLLIGIFFFAENAN